MKKYLIGLIVGIAITCVIQIFIMKSWERADVNLLLQLITGIAPFAAAFGAYYMWSKNRDYKNDYYKKIIDQRIIAYRFGGQYRFRFGAGSSGNKKVFARACGPKIF